ncbi:hypothetical protein JAAARDRAFT_67957 [Jaapia argillacea MUCL 33604]|uniref:RRM domain-containing protein n=1 Tax=Jaapia argillacea MUCL 33604 TaxID=933084 RepID=A0A067Q2R9_9AGAM|nr:hypothetical protein JAAARDRAFT_67957 [Jaapia argillacea MUCL 33604]
MRNGSPSDLDSSVPTHSPRPPSTLDSLRRGLLTPSPPISIDVVRATPSPASIGSGRPRITSAPTPSNSMVSDGSLVDDYYLISPTVGVSGTTSDRNDQSSSLGNSAKPESDAENSAALTSKKISPSAPPFIPSNSASFTTKDNTGLSTTPLKATGNSIYHSIHAPASLAATSNGPQQGQSTFSSTTGNSLAHSIHAPANANTSINSSNSTSASSVAHSVSSTSSSPATASSSLKTPNVYINGLPPNFPEEQLYHMTKDFGVVVSVRTFTRHVSERPTGYGFVLFETADAAERCIDALRRYRNLHPSFSKQVHKIPGTVFAAVNPPTGGISTQGSDLSSSGSVFDDYGRDPREMRVGEDASSFKARMERLKDGSSTNLYIEGLPLSIDEPTLAALVSPYTIKSSRFFQTKLSHPPRIIAFVRLETRPACEEIIERLHGRMVRGWNDAGCRISVRFADSNEQRELRKTERCVREGDNSPGRLTMAQAALLNLRGSDLRNTARSAYSASSPTLSSSNMGLQPEREKLPPHPLTMEFQQKQAQQREMNLLLETLKASGMSTAGLGGISASGGLGMGIGAMDAGSLMNEMASGWGTSVNAGPGGFTPAEQLLLQTHAHLQAQASLGMNAGVAGMRGSRQLDFLGQQQQARASKPGHGQYSPFTPSSAIELLPAMSEEEFHASSGQQQYQFQDTVDDYDAGYDAVPQGSGFGRPLLDRLGRRHQAQVPAGHRVPSGFHPSLSHQQHHHRDLPSAPPSNSNLANGRNIQHYSTPQLRQSQQPQQQQVSSLHVRATTLPGSHFSSGQPRDNGQPGAKVSGGDPGGGNLKIDSEGANSKFQNYIHSPEASPALTYASRTPSSSSFSPATPYFSGEGYGGYESAVRFAGNFGGNVGLSSGIGLGMAGLGIGIHGKGKARAVSHS